MTEEGTGKYSTFLHGETAVNGGSLSKRRCGATTKGHRQKPKNTRQSLRVGFGRLGRLLGSRQ